MTYQEWIAKAEGVWAYIRNEGWMEFALCIVVGYVLIRIIRRIFDRLSRSRRLPVQMVRFCHKFLVSLIWVMVSIQALRAVGVDLIGIMGAAGVAGVAIGFASQTALSNLISGFFLVTERSFALGDYVRIDNLEGTVESINMLSIYLRQPDNALIRIPCETIIKNPVINFTRNKIRRCDFEIGVDYSSDLEHVRKILAKTAAEQPLLLQTPPPAIQFIGYGDSSLNIRIGAYCSAENYHAARYDLAHAILNAFRAEGISIPFPIRDLRITRP